MLVQNQSSCASLIRFPAYLLYDTSQIVHGGETTYVMATLGLYMNIYSLFINLLQLLRHPAANGNNQDLLRQ